MGLVRAPAVAILVVAVAGTFVPAARSDEAPPATTPTATVEAPPPDPYRPPVRSAKQKAATPSRKPAVVHAAPVAPATPRSSSPAPIVRQPAVRTQRVARPRAKKAAARPTRKAARRPVAAKPKPVTVTFNPFAGVVTGAEGVTPSPAGDERNRYLLLAGLAFALLAIGALSLHLVSVRFLQMRLE